MKFAGALVGELRSATKLHKEPVKSASFRVLKAPDIPPVLLELGYVTNREDLSNPSPARPGAVAPPRRSREPSTPISARGWPAGPPKWRKLMNIEDNYVGPGPQFQHKTGSPRVAGMRRRLAAGHKAVRFAAHGVARPNRRRGRGDKVLACPGGASAMRLTLRFFGLLFTAGTILFLVGRRRGRCAPVALLQGTAGLFAVAGLRARGHEARARLR